MSVEAVCAMCGKTFIANANDERGPCAECQAAAVSERPVSPSAHTEIQDERIMAGFPPAMDRMSSTPKPEGPTSLPGCIVAAALLGAALAVMLLLTCGKPP